MTREEIECDFESAVAEACYVYRMYVAYLARLRDRQMEEANRKVDNVREIRQALIDFEFAIVEARTEWEQQVQFAQDDSEGSHAMLDQEEYETEEAYYYDDPNEEEV